MRKAIGSAVLVVGSAMFLRGLAYYTAAMMISDLDPGWKMSGIARQALAENQLIWQLGGIVLAVLGAVILSRPDETGRGT